VNLNLPVDVGLYAGEVEMLKIPIRSRQSHGDTVGAAKSCSHFLDKCHVVGSVGFRSTTVISLWILVTVINQSSSFGRRTHLPIQIHSIEAVSVHEAAQAVDESSSVT
jgi:hypothetical protein